MKTDCVPGEPFRLLGLSSFIPVSKARVYSLVLEILQCCSSIQVTEYTTSSNNASNIEQRTNISGVSYDDGLSTQENMGDEQEQ
jgi:hypothetical protein